MQSDKVKQFLEFLAKHELCVLSTVSADGRSESALVGFSETENLELIIGTTRESRKVRNLTANPAVSVVIGWDEGSSVQYEGVARVLGEATELQRYQASHFAKLPGAEKFKDRPESCYIVITPQWLRYTDITKKPRLIEEFTV